MIFESKKNKILEFHNWIKTITKDSKFKIGWEGNVYKHLKQQITNSINLKRIQKNIEYIINDPQNIKGQAPNDWHRLTYIKKNDKIIYTMDINGKDRMAYIIDGDVIIFSMIGHIEY